MSREKGKRPMIDEPSKVNFTRKKQVVSGPRGKQKRLQLLAKKGIETGGPVGDGAAAEEEVPAPTPTQTFTDFERMQLSIARSIAVWFKNSHAIQRSIVSNQKRLAEELKVGGLESLVEPTFRYHKTVEKAIVDAMLSDVESSEEDEDGVVCGMETSASDSSDESGSSSSSGDGGEEEGTGAGDGEDTPAS